MKEESEKKELLYEVPLDSYVQECNIFQINGLIGKFGKLIECSKTQPGFEYSHWNGDNSIQAITGEWMTLDIDNTLLAYLEVMVGKKLDSFNNYKSWCFEKTTNHNPTPLLIKFNDDSKTYAISPMENEVDPYQCSCKICKQKLEQISVEFFKWLDETYPTKKENGDLIV